MALNYKSYQFESTGSQSVVPVNCNTTSCLVRSATVYNSTASTLTCIPRVQKDGQAQISLKAFSITSGQTVSLLIEPVILENGDVFSVTFGGSGLVLFVSYVESTAVLNATSVKELSDWSTTAPADGQIPVWDNASGQYVPTTSGATLTDTSGLPEQSSGTEPWNRYMKNLDALDPLTDVGANVPEDVLSGTPGNVNFVVENNTLSPAPPQKVTFEQIIQALMAGPLGDMANDPNNNLSLATFTGSGGLGDLDNDGAVGSNDLIAFLIYFGNSWAGSNSGIFQESIMVFEDGLATILNDTTWTTLEFDSADYTVIAGTQNVSVDYTTNHSVEFESQTSPYLLKDVLNKYIELKTNTGALGLVQAELAGQRITIRATIDLYDSSDVALGSQGVFEWKEESFDEAGVSVWVQPGVLEITNDLIATECGVTDGMENDSFNSIVITLQAKTSAGSATMDLRTPMITLKQY